MAVGGSIPHGQARADTSLEERAKAGRAYGMPHRTDRAAALRRDARHEIGKVDPGAGTDSDGLGAGWEESGAGISGSRSSSSN